MEFLKETPVKSLLDKKQLIIIDANSCVKEACQKLSDNKISSAPVYESGKCLGVLDYNHLVTFVLQTLHKVPKDEPVESDISLNITDVVKEAIPDMPIKTLISSQKYSTHYCTIDANDNIHDALKKLVNEDVSRLLVIDRKAGPEIDSRISFEEETFVGVFSATSVISFIANKFVVPNSCDWEIGNTPISKLDIIRHDFPTVTSQDSCLDALQVLHSKNVHSVAIVGKMTNGASQLLGSISMSDIKEILSSKKHWRHIFDSSFDFFRFMRSEQGIRHGKDTIPSFTVTQETTLLNVMKKMTAVKTHQVWVTGENQELMGVVGVCSIAKILNA